METQPIPIVNLVPTAAATAAGTAATSAVKNTKALFGGLACGGVILSFLALVSFIWIVIICVNPCWVQYQEDPCSSCPLNPCKKDMPDPTRALIASLIIAFIIVVLFGAIAYFCKNGC